MKKSGRQEDKKKRKRKEGKSKKWREFPKGRSHPGHFHFWGTGEMVHPVIRPSFSKPSGASLSFNFKRIAGWFEERRNKKRKGLISPLWCLTQILKLLLICRSSFLSYSLSLYRKLTRASFSLCVRAFIQRRSCSLLEAIVRFGLYV